MSIGGAGLSFDLGKSALLVVPISASGAPVSGAPPLLGAVRSEALLTDRAAHYVCYIGSGSRDRIITVRETEHVIAMSLLKVCQTYPCQ